MSRSEGPQQSPDTPPVEILVVNQHGDNTGDEAATRGMLHGLSEQFPAARFTVLHQFRDPASEFATAHDVRWLPLVLEPFDALRLVAFLLLRWTGQPARRLLGRQGREVVEAYERADLVVSAPGGPYLGDLYWSHEPVHWFYVWAAGWFGIPVGLYAPSAGPFARRWMNPFRRKVFGRFGRVTLREQRSADHVRTLTRGRIEPTVTADAALQQRVGARDRGSWMVGGRPLDDAVVVAVSAIDWPYRGDPDPAARKANYDAAILAAVIAVVEEVGETTRVHVVFVPQLHSERHRDAPYLRQLADRLPPGVTSEVADGDRTSAAQRSIFAAADLVIAGRYHPAVFAVSARVPVLCVPYEHKAAGLMEAAGLGEWVVPLDAVTPDVLDRRARQLWREREKVRRALDAQEPQLRARARSTNALIASLVTPVGVVGQD